MAERRWWRGSTHTHTIYSDGDSPPEVVADWYGEHGYDFLFLTDHNVLIPQPHLKRLQRPGLPVWQGEEVTMAAVHVNGLGLRRVILPKVPGKHFAEPHVRTSPSARLGWALQRIASQRGVAIVNHPLLWQALDESTLADQADLRLLEIANMKPDMVVEDGDGATEALWDRLLARGRPIWGVASDDAHHFQRWGQQWANPGRGWVLLEASELTLDACLRALNEGRFCSSTGPGLADYRPSRQELSIVLASGPARIELIGVGGRVLDSVDGSEACFRLKADHSPYVRIRATDQSGGRLWTQPMFRE